MWGPLPFYLSHGTPPPFQQQKEQGLGRLQNPKPLNPQPLHPNPKTPPPPLSSQPPPPTYLNPKTLHPNPKKPPSLSSPPPTPPTEASIVEVRFLNQNVLDSHGREPPEL